MENYYKNLERFRVDKTGNLKFSNQSTRPKKLALAKGKIATLATATVLSLGMLSQGMVTASEPLDFVIPPDEPISDPTKQHENQKSSSYKSPKVYSGSQKEEIPDPIMPPDEPISNLPGYTQGGIAGSVTIKPQSKKKVSQSTKKVIATKKKSSKKSATVTKPITTSKKVILKSKVEPKKVIAQKTAPKKVEQPKKSKPVKSATQPKETPKQVEETNEQEKWMQHFKENVSKIENDDETTIIVKVPKELNGKVTIEIDEDGNVTISTQKELKQEMPERNDH